MVVKQICNFLGGWDQAGRPSFRYSPLKSKSKVSCIILKGWTHSASIISQHVSLSLLLSDEPEIEVEAEKVHSGLGKEAHLTCIVHGEPRPLVSSLSTNINVNLNLFDYCRCFAPFHPHNMICKRSKSRTLGCVIPRHDCNLRSTFFYHLCLSGVHPC